MIFPRPMSRFHAAAQLQARKGGSDMKRCVFVFAVLLLGAKSSCNSTDHVLHTDDADIDSDADTETPLVWEWEELGLIPGMVDGTYFRLRLWAVDEDDVVICASGEDNSTGETFGGIVRYDGGGFLVDVSGMPCGIVWGSSDGQVWAELVTPDLGDSGIYRRDGSEWREEDIEESEECYGLSFFESSGGVPMLMRRCEVSDELEERRVWAHDGDSWVRSEAIVPTVDQLYSVRGAFQWNGAGVFYGEAQRRDPEGDSELGPAAFFVSDLVTDIGAPQDIAIWAAPYGEDGIVALGVHALYEFEGGVWTSVASCPDDLASDVSCWNAGVVHGGVILGGGHGCAGDWGSDDLRLHYWDGETLTSIYPPCGGEEPYCQVEDLSATALSPETGPVWALIRENWRTRLVRTTLPTE